jgi:hypothetical protein
MATLARLAPEAVVQNVMPIFTFMGSNVFHRDDPYSFRVVQKVFEYCLSVYYGDTNGWTDGGQHCPSDAGFIEVVVSSEGRSVDSCTKFSASGHRCREPHTTASPRWVILHRYITLFHG